MTEGNIVESHNDSIIGARVARDLMDHVDTERKQQIIAFINMIAPFTGTQGKFMASALQAFLGVNPKETNAKVFRLFFIASIMILFTLVVVITGAWGKLTSETDVNSFVLFLESVKVCANFIKYINFTMLPAVSDTLADMPLATTTTFFVVLKNIISSSIKEISSETKTPLQKTIDVVSGTVVGTAKNGQVILSAASMNLAAGANPFRADFDQRKQAIDDFIKNIDNGISHAKNKKSVVGLALGAFSFWQAASGQNTVRQTIIKNVFSVIRSTLLIPLIPIAAQGVGAGVGTIARYVTVQRDIETLQQLYQQVGNGIARRGYVTNANRRIAGVSNVQRINQQ